MNFHDTGRIIIGSKYEPAKRPKIDTGWQQIILKMNEIKDTTAVQRGFFNALPAHIAGLWAHRSSNGKGLEA